MVEKERGVLVQRFVLAGGIFSGNKALLEPAQISRSTLFRWTHWAGLIAFALATQAHRVGQVFT